MGLAPTLVRTYNGGTAFPSLLLSLHSVEVPLQMPHGITRKCVGYVLISSLRIDVDVGVGELMKDVKHLQTRSKLLLQE